ncbi:MAG: molecular chaperone HtpG, partial [Phocaeicola sp.]|nr:molecular chaperone HtpG [Phocaeicola sp.]
ESELRKAQENKKADEITTAEKDELSDVESKLSAQKEQKEKILADYAAGNKVVHQLIDLALLQNNMLKGEALTNFVKRSIELI